MTRPKYIMRIVQFIRHTKREPTRTTKTVSLLHCSAIQAIPHNVAQGQ
jgi:hypothetical protein